MDWSRSFCLGLSFFMLLHFQVFCRFFYSRFLFELKCFYFFSLVFFYCILFSSFFLSFFVLWVLVSFPYINEKFRFFEQNKTKNKTKCSYSYKISS